MHWRIGVALAIILAAACTHVPTSPLAPNIAAMTPQAVFGVVRVSTVDNVPSVSIEVAGTGQQLHVVGDPCETLLADMNGKSVWVWGRIAGDEIIPAGHGSALPSSGG
jgi:hypothetical protein